MKISFYGHVRQIEAMRDELYANLEEVMASGSYVMGPMLKRFEQELAAYAGTKYAIGVGNGTDALWLTMMALGIGPGDEVITHANTFFATVEAIWITGAKAVLVDCDPLTKCIDPEQIEAAVTDRTKAIIPVHLYGQCAPMDAIRPIADKHGLHVIEDNAQGIDGHGDVFKQGELSDAICTSFIIQKNLGTFGDGGGIMTNRPEIDATVRKLRNHGSAKRDVHSFGFNSRLDDIHAGFLSAKLKHISEWTDRRIEIAARYDEGLKDCSCISLPFRRPGYRHVYHLYVIETKDTQDRARLLSFLNDEGIDAKTHYSIAIHQQEGFPWGKEVSLVGSLEHASRNAASCISLPMYPELRDDEVDDVIAKVVAFDRAGNP